MTPKLSLKQLFHLPTNSWVRNSGQGTAGMFSFYSTNLGSELGRLKGSKQHDDWGWNHQEVSSLTNLAVEAGSSLGPQQGLSTGTLRVASPCSLVFLGVAGLLTWQLRAPKVSVPVNKVEAAPSFLT